MEGAFRQQRSLQSLALEIGLCVCIAVAASLTASATLSRLRHHSKPHLTCATDWQLCKDNLDLMKHYAGRSTAQVACSVAANIAVKRGVAKLPLQHFDAFHGGDHYVQSGVITLIEPHAKYPDEQGQMRPKTVTCDFDLARHKVTDLIIVAAD